MARTYEELVESGRKAKQEMDAANWRLGELAAGVFRAHGKDGLRRWVETLAAEGMDMRRANALRSQYESWEATQLPTDQQTFDQIAAEEAERRRTHRAMHGDD